MIPKYRQTTSPTEILKKEFNININNQTITPELAQRLATLTHTTYQFWLNLQRNYNETRPITP